MADPNLLELAKEEPAIIKQRRKGVIVRLGRVKQVDHSWSIQLNKKLRDAKLGSKQQTILQRPKFCYDTRSKSDMPHVPFDPFPLIITY